MQFALMLESRPEIPFETVRALALEAERCRFAALLHADHLLSVTVQNDPPAGVDAWVVLAALGSVTTIRLGVRMSPPTWRDRRCSRSPPPRWIGSRVVGWRSVSGAAGTSASTSCRRAVRSAPQRFDRLEELGGARGLWTTEGFSFAGRYVSVDDAPQVPTAQVPHPPIAIGGAGHRRTPALAARFADEFNAFNGTVDATAAAYAAPSEPASHSSRIPPRCCIPRTW